MNLISSFNNMLSPIINSRMSAVTIGPCFQTIPLARTPHEVFLVFSYLNFQWFVTIVKVSVCSIAKRLHFAMATGTV